MNALTADLLSVRSAVGDAMQLRTVLTHSGFTVAVVPKNKHDTTYFAEVFLKVVGVFLIPLGGLSLFLPQIVQGPAYVVAQLGMLAAFIFVGVAVHRRADRGFRQKIYVDGLRDEIRVGTVNINGDFYETAVYSMAKIESFFIVRSKNTSTPARLKMRLKSGARTIALIEGPEATCIRILERISFVMNPPKTNARSFITQKTGAFIRMTFG